MVILIYLVRMDTWILSNIKFQIKLLTISLPIYLK